ncbi:MAG: ATP-binding cassette domain-containing protein [Lactobacillaceae bacterium]|jgi:peptide/nickel transport system ATP-binding protein|nr:ATP-binding cassette domain-containing protein [Lactobacillaceae bacterium]
MGELLRIEDLRIHYPIRGGFFNRVVDKVYAVDGVSFSINEGETYGLVGESGSGKTTIGSTIVGLEKATSGKVIYKGEDVTTPAARRKLNYNRDVQMIFQDSMSSLNPRKTIYDIISEPIKNFEKLDKNAEEKRVAELLDIVGLPQRTMYQYPFQFSGGQRQRIGIARAISTNPKLIVADEPVSALDLSVQAQVLNFMKQIQKNLGISFLFISHDLGVVRHMTNNIAIMHLGRFVELGTRDDVFKDPQHIYTKRLLAAIPQTDVAHREENKANRLRIEEEYQNNRSFYYGADGRPYPFLKDVSDTHKVAMNADEFALAEAQTEVKKEESK